MKRGKTLLTALLILLLQVSAGFANGQQESAVTETGEWKPTRPVTIVVYAGAGGGTDLAARGLGKAFEEYFGVPFTVVNMTGGAGGVAANHVWNQKHDGYTLFGCSSGVHSLNVVGAFDVTNDNWEYKMALGTPGVLSVSSDSPYKTIEELVEAGKNTTLKSSASSAGCVWDLKVSQLEQMGKIKVNHMPYEGSQPSMVAALSHEVDFTVTGLAEEREYILADKLRPLAVIEKEAVVMDGYGEIPSLSSAYPEFESLPSPMVWTGIGIPSDTPQNIKDAYEKAFVAAMASDRMKQLSEDTKWGLLGIQGAEAADITRQQDSIYSWALYDLGSAKKSPEEFGIGRL